MTMTREGGGGEIKKLGRMSPRVTPDRFPVQTLFSSTTTIASASLSRSLRPGTAAASPSLLLRGVGRPFSVGWGVHTKGGPVKWEAQPGE